jgi:hypothetical protein
MSSIRFPVLIWKDANGLFGACAIHDPEDSAAVGLTRSDVLDQVKDYFAYVHRNNPRLRAPELDDAKLTHLTIHIRPEYETAAEETPRSRTRRKQLFASTPIALPLA